MLFQIEPNDPMALAAAVAILLAAVLAAGYGPAFAHRVWTPGPRFAKSSPRAVMSNARVPSKVQALSVPVECHGRTARVNTRLGCSAFKLTRNAHQEKRPPRIAPR